ncbi:MAG: acyl-CoA dehydrogenase [Candidatus Nanopelagicales bacterium]|nr:acyl-CoA dehydrogenase [Candidatus Nanopelagicales bacterium]
MSLALTEEHRSLADVARSLLADNGGLAPARATLDVDHEVLPAFWSAFQENGMFGLHLPESVGGQGFGLEELAIVVEELGRVVAPGAFLPSVVTSTTIAAAGTEAQRTALLPGFAAGTSIAGFALRSDIAVAGGKATGTAKAVTSAELATHLAIVVGDDLVIVDAKGAGVTITPNTAIDATRRNATVVLAGADAEVIAGGGAVALRVGRVLASAEAAGGSRAATEMSVAYAKIREQFGRTISTFQAIKHHCANMIIQTEMATALAWDGARTGMDPKHGDIAAASAAALALPAFEFTARKNIQIHGGIGFTWEHDAHIFFKRSAALAALFGTSDDAAAELTALSANGNHRVYALELPPEAEAFRAEAKAAVAKYHAAAEQDQRAVLLETGYLVPHWGKPWGREASAVEQIVIEEEFTGITIANPGITSWVGLTLSQVANEEQIARWIRPALMMETTWCQLFSEPGAGSDAAAVATKAVKVDGGWKVDGQKVWTSGAQYAQWGLCTVRTDPDAPKHKGVTAMAIKMDAPGVTIRPLRENTGEAMFNEVFFDGVFVPDADVVGEIDNGWAVARATLGNERVTIGGQARAGIDAYELIELLPGGPGADLGHDREVGKLVAQEQVIRLLNLRAAARAVVGAGPGAEGNITKVLVSELAQSATELAMKLVGDAGIDGERADIAFQYIFNRCLTIAGGTSEISRNVIAERILGMPRDPLIR